MFCKECVLRYYVFFFALFLADDNTAILIKHHVLIVAFTKSYYFRMLERAIYYYWTHIIHCINLAMGNVCFLYMQLIIQHWNIRFRFICKIHFQHGDNSYTGVMGAYWHKSCSRLVKCESCPWQVLYVFKIQWHCLYCFHIELYWLKAKTMSYFILNFY